MLRRDNVRVGAKASLKESLRTLITRLNVREEEITKGGEREGDQGTHKVRGRGTRRLQGGGGGWGEENRGIRTRMRRRKRTSG